MVRTVLELATLLSWLLVAAFVYMTALAAMTGTALTSGRPLAAAGGLLFYLSDGLITWRRFVRHHRALDHAVIITYYAAQFCLAMSASAGYSAM